MISIEYLRILIAEGDLEAPFAALAPPAAGTARRAALVALALLPAAVEAARACSRALPARVAVALPVLRTGPVHLLFVVLASPYLLGGAELTEVRGKPG